MIWAVMTAPSTPRPPFPVAQTETWVFDLDNTLYNAATDLFSQISQRMGVYIQSLLNLDADAARAVQKQYFHDYGTTLRGLMTVHGIDPRDFLADVHDIDYAPIVADPALDRALERLPGRKIIFTNADVPHTDRVLDRLGVTRHFDAVFDIAAADYTPKPAPEIYTALVDQYGMNPARATMVEDIARNLEPACALGMATVWVRTDTRWGALDHDAAYIHHRRFSTPKP